MIPRKFTREDTNRIVEHLCKLQGEDRRLRFGMVVTDNYIENYVFSSFDTDSKWIGCVHDEAIISACHVSVNNGQAELGCSVDKEFRNHKLAQAMFDRAVMWLRTRGITDVFMHCLTENGAMKHIASKNYMTVVSEGGESDANVQVAPATPFTPMVDAYVDRMALYDMIFKNNLSVLKRMYT